MQAMDGLLIIDKPGGLTSHDVVAQVRRILGERRVGHTGTLDPFATGVLVVLVGKATRLAQFFSGAEKEYEAVIRLGYATDTGDATGARLSRSGNAGARVTVESEMPVHSYSEEEIETALKTLRGEIEQVPPMYSAKKFQGWKLYELARRGEEIERHPVKVTIFEFESLNREGRLLTNNADGTRDLSVRVVCSAGTYIRVLAEDFGKRLGVSAHLAALRRTRAGDFLVHKAVTLEQLRQIAADGLLESFMVPPAAALSRLPSLHLRDADAHRARNGVAVRVPPATDAQWGDGENVKLLDKKGDLLAIGFYIKANQLLHPRVVLVTDRT
jgi:tRNA pseudouridine55 synthase